MTNTPLPTERNSLLQRAQEDVHYDLAVVGGGATGLSVALDAAQRGWRVILLEAHDFAKGSSSRATKLAHGGVRYLAQGNIALVREALHERTWLLNSAPHLAQALAFIMPSYKIWETPFYGVGLKIYDVLAGKAGLGRTEWLSARRAHQLLPGARQTGLKGGVKYWDGQFDDARLALAIARTAATHGALLLNYCQALQVVHEDQRAVGLRLRDQESGHEWNIRAGCIVNAAGVWVDRLRQQEARATGQELSPMVETSQGTHVVVDASFLPGEHALLVPKTRDGRVLFAVPWLGKLILGTTDEKRDDAPLEPHASAAEIDFILGEAARYLARAPQRSDVLSVWSGLRPLVRPGGQDEQDTQKISREHVVRIARSGLVSVTGGKWTTCRAMAADVLHHCVQSGGLPDRGPSHTASLKLVGAPDKAVSGGMHLPPGPHSYGTEIDMVESLPGKHNWLAPGLSEAMLRFAVRHEYARCVEDVLARRSRLLFLDAKTALEAAPAVAGIMQDELGGDPGQAAFEQMAEAYLLRQ